MKKITSRVVLAFICFSSALYADLPGTIIPQARTEAEEHWVSHHEEKVAMAKKGDIDLILIGDSITAFGERQQLYSYYFGKRKVLNLGQGGDGTQNVLWRLQHGEVDGLKPKLVVLMIGTNNSRADKPDDVVLGIKTILSEIRQRLPGAQVLLFSIFPRKAGPENDTIQIVNQQLPALADNVQVIHMDITRDFMNAEGSLNETLFYKDLLHLSDKGYQLWWEKMEPVVSQALGVESFPPTLR